MPWRQLKYIDIEVQPKLSMYLYGVFCVHCSKFVLDSYCVFAKGVCADTTHEICRHAWLCCRTDIFTVDLVPTSERFVPCSLVFICPKSLERNGSAGPAKGRGSECLRTCTLQKKNAEVQTTLTAGSGSWVTMPWRNMKTCWQKSNRSRTACATALYIVVVLACCMSDPGEPFSVLTELLRVPSNSSTWMRLFQGN